MCTCIHIRSTYSLIMSLIFCTNFLLMISQLPPPSPALLPYIYFLYTRCNYMPSLFFPYDVIIYKVQFGHAGACANGERETALAKNLALKVKIRSTGLWGYQDGWVSAYIFDLYLSTCTCSTFVTYIIEKEINVLISVCKQSINCIMKFINIQVTSNLVFRYYM